MSDQDDDIDSMIALDDLVDRVFGDIIDDQELDRAERGGVLSALRLPAAPQTATQAVLESADLDIRTCVHELAYALASLFGSDVTLGELPAEAVEAARRVRALIATYPRCQLKGAS